MGMAAGDVVLFADRKNTIDFFGHYGMLVIARVPELLAQITFADQHDADAGHFFQDARQVVDSPHLLALNNDEDFAIWRERPNIGALVIFLLGETPIACRTCRRIAADTRWIVKR